MANIILIGFMGAGKTTLGIKLAKRLQVPFVDTDQRIEQEQQRPISDIFAKEGEAFFRNLETQQLDVLWEEVKDSVISVGGGLPVQPVNYPLLKKIGTTVYLKASKETLVERLEGDSTRPLLQGGQLEQKIADLMAAREPIYERVADVVVETDGKTIEDVMEEITALVK